MISVTQSGVTFPRLLISTFRRRIVVQSKSEPQQKVAMGDASMNVRSVRGGLLAHSER